VDYKEKTTREGGTLGGFDKLIGQDHEREGQQKRGITSGEHNGARRNQTMTKMKVGFCEKTKELERIGALQGGGD